jgi:predicted Fe-Mo cluster-binding NifX family protein
MKIAVPVDSGGFCEHFGGAEAFQIYGANGSNDGLASVESLPAPEHKPGALPKWLGGQGVHAVVVSAIGEPALKLLSRLGIRAHLSIDGLDPAGLAVACLLGKLPVASVENSRCSGGHNDEQDHHHHHHHHGHACRH